VVARGEVIQTLLDLFENPRYLEIGVQNGVTFLPIRAAKKIAVDPIFAFSLPPLRVTPTIEYHEVTSDEYFGSIVNPEDKFEVIYLDGLHTLEQTLRDLLSATNHLKDGGVIVVDDVIPTTFSSSLPNENDVRFLRNLLPSEAADASWMGDVFRLVFFVESFMQGWQFATIADNHGQLIMWRAARRKVSNPVQTVMDVGSLDYVGMLKRSAEMRRIPFVDIVECFKGDRRIIR
jgi:Methyltransferase domain